MYGINDDGSAIDLTNLNYESIWDSLKLNDWQREIARKIIDLYIDNQNSPKTNDEIERYANDIRRGELKKYGGRLEIALKISGGEKDVAGILIDAEVLKRDTKLPLYSLDLKKLSKLERKF